MELNLQAARVLALFWGPRAGEPMFSVESLRLEEGRGIANDRYALGIGSYSSVEPGKDRHLTLITQEALQIADAWQRAAGLEPFSAAMTRRNVVVDHMSVATLNGLVGHRFRIGEVLCEGVEWATPCERPSSLSGIPGFPDAFEGRGGLRARVLTDGVIEVGMLCESVPTY